jgi:hypothetical protein
MDVEGRVVAGHRGVGGDRAGGRRAAGAQRGEAGPQREIAGQAREAVRRADTSEHVANLILEAIKTGEPEVFAHDSMKNAMR